MNAKDSSARTVIAIAAFAILCALGFYILSFFVRQQRNVVVKQLDYEYSKLNSALKVVKEIEPLEQTYLNGSAGAARESLVKEIGIIENSGLPNAQMIIARLPCCRLYVLDKRLGSPKLAEASLVKARYWYLRDLEIGSNQDAQVAKDLLEFTPDEVEKLVDDWDKSATGGRGPTYLSDRSLPDTQPGQ